MRCIGVFEATKFSMSSMLHDASAVGMYLNPDSAAMSVFTPPGAIEFTVMPRERFKYLQVDDRFGVFDRNGTLHYMYLQ